MVYPATQRNEPEDMNPRDQLRTFNSRTIREREREEKKNLYIDMDWLISSCSCCCRRRCCWWVQYFVCPCRSQRPKYCHWRIGLSREIRTFLSITLGYMPHAQISKQWQMIDAECREKTADILLFRMMIAPKLLSPSPPPPTLLSEAQKFIFTASILKVSFECRLAYPLYWAAFFTTFFLQSFQHIRTKFQQPLLHWAPRMTVRAS